MIVFFLFLIGTIFIVAGFRGKAEEVGDILISDFTGSPGFIVWIIAVAIIGFLVSNQYTEKVGSAFFALLLVVLFLSNRGFFAEFSAQTLR